MSPVRAALETRTSPSAAYGNSSPPSGRSRSPSESTTDCATARLRSTWICESTGSVYHPGTWSEAPLPICPAMVCRAFTSATADAAV